MPHDEKPVPRVFFALSPQQAIISGSFSKRLI